MNFIQDNPAIFASLVAFLGVIIAAGIQLLIAKKNRLALTVSSNRQKWLDQFVNTLSSLLGTVAFIINTEANVTYHVGDQAKIDFLKDILSKTFTVIFILDQENAMQKELSDKLKALLSVRKYDQDRILSLIADIERLSHQVIRTEKELIRRSK